MMRSDGRRFYLSLRVRLESTQVFFSSTSIIEHPLVLLELIIVCWIRQLCIVFLWRGGRTFHIACPFFWSTPCLTPLDGCAFLASGLFLVWPFAWVRFCVSSLSVFRLLVCLCSACFVSVFSVCLPLSSWALRCLFVVLCLLPSLPPSVASVWRPGPVNL